MGQIIQIAFELRNITQQALDDESSSAEEEDDVIAIEKRDEMANWFKFCKEKIEKIEKVWNRKLDERHRSEDDDDLNDKDDYNLEQDFDTNDVDKTEKRLEQMLANITNRRRENVSSVKGGSFVAQSVPVPELQQAVIDAEAAAAAKSKDDSTIKQRTFDQNQYWKMPDSYSLEELLAEQSEEQEVKPASVVAELSKSEVPESQNYLPPVQEESKDEDLQPAIDQLTQGHQEESKSDEPAHATEEEAKTEPEQAETTTTEETKEIQE